MEFNAFVTAGGLISGDFALKAGTDIKALINIGGVSILQRTIDSLKQSGCINKIALVAPESVRERPETSGVDDFITADSSGSINIMRGLKHFNNDRFVILCTSDLPFITPEAVRDFIARCGNDASIYYPVFERDEIDESFKAGVPSYIKFRDGHFTGGSIFKLEPKVLVPKMEEVAKSFNARKSTVAMAKLLGWKIVLKMLLGVCSIDDVLSRAGELIGGKCEAVRGCHPGITVDIDDEASYGFAMELVKKSGDYSDA
jgi:GTP:adenosylcobinamide-phosphate guanylyltransferase